MDAMDPTGAGELGAVKHEIGRIAAAIRNALVEALRKDDLEDSRDLLAGLCRTLGPIEAHFMGDSHATDEVAATGPSRRDGWYHVGSVWAIWRHLPLFCRGAITDTEIIWLDELDELDDRQLRSFNRIGTKSIEQLRLLLDTYYWRTEPDTSEAFWLELESDLRRDLDYPYLGAGERVRIEQGLAFAQGIICSAGAPLANRAAARESVA